MRFLFLSLSPPPFSCPFSLSVFFPINKKANNARAKRRPSISSNGRRPTAPPAGVLVPTNTTPYLWRSQEKGDRRAGVHRQEV